MLLDLAKLALESLLSLFGLAPDKTRRELPTGEVYETFDLDGECRADNFDVAEAGRQVAIGYTGVLTGDEMNLGAFASYDSAQQD